MVRPFLCLALTTVLAAPALAQELVANGSFERGNGDPSGWGHSDPAHVSWQPKGRSGKCVHVGVPPMDMPAASWSQEIKDFQPETLHVFSAWVRADDSGTARVILSGLKLYRDEGTTFTTPVGRKWRLWRFPVAGVQGNSQNIQIIFQNEPAAGNTFYVDDVSFVRRAGINMDTEPVRKAAVPAGAREKGNLIPNGRLEVREISRPAGWFHHDPALMPRSKEGKYFVDPAREKARNRWENKGFGGRSLSLTLVKDSGWGGWFTQLQGVEPKTDYQLEFWFRMPRDEALVVFLFGKALLVRGAGYDPRYFWRYSTTVNSGKAWGHANVGFVSEAWQSDVSTVRIDRVRFVKRATASPPEPPEAAAARRKAALEALKKKADALLARAKGFEDAGKPIEACRIYRRVLTDYAVLGGESLLDPAPVRVRMRQAGLAAVAQGLGRPAPGREKHEDPVFGVEFPPPEGWRGIPPPPVGDGTGGADLRRACVYFYPDVDDLSLSVYRIGEVTSLPLVERAANVLVAGLSKGARGDFRSKPLKVRGLKASARTLTNAAEGDLFHVVHLHHASGVGAALVLAWRGVAADAVSGEPARKAARDRAWKALEGLNAKVAAKFKLILPNAIARYRKKLRDRASCAGWEENKTKNYLVEYAGDDALARETGRRLEELLELYRELVPSRKKPPPAFMKMFPDRTVLEAYDSGAVTSGTIVEGGPGDLVSYPYRGGRLDVPAMGEMLVADETEAARLGFGLMARAAFDHYHRRALKGRRGGSLPPWLLGGLSDCFLAASVSGRDVSFGVHEAKRPVIYRAVFTGAHIPLREFLAYRPEDFGERPALCQAQGWALANFLLESDKASYKKLIPTILTRMDFQDEDFRTATENALRTLEIDVDKLEAEWSTYILAKTRPSGK